MKMYRQGDLLFIEVIEHQEIEQAKTDIIHLGSSNGNAHTLKDGRLYFIEITRDGAIAYIESDGEATINHKEHKSIQLPKGMYEVRRQREVEGYVID